MLVLGEKFLSRSLFISWKKREQIVKEDKSKQTSFFVLLYGKRSHAKPTMAINFDFRCLSERRGSLTSVTGISVFN